MDILLLLLLVKEKITVPLVELAPRTETDNTTIDYVRVPFISPSPLRDGHQL